MKHAVVSVHTCLWRRNLARASRFALSAVLLLIGACAANAQRYTFTDIGVLNPNDPVVLNIKINNSGQIAAVSRDSNGLNRVVRITPQNTANGLIWFADANNDGVNDLMKPYSVPANTDGYDSLTAMNASGQIAGRQQGVATLWNANGTINALFSNLIQNQNTESSDMNDNGDVVGFPFYDWDAYLWQYTKGSYAAVPLGKPPGYEGARAFSVNNLRQVIGILTGGVGPAGFLWLPAPAYGLPQGFTVLNDFIPYGFRLHGINDEGIILGRGLPPDNYQRMFIWVPPGVGATYGLADGVNEIVDNVWPVVQLINVNNPRPGEPLQMVGNVQDAAGNRYAAVWDSAHRKAQNLNALTTNLPNGFVMEGASGINDVGQIVGTGTLNGLRRGFVLNPIPVPTVRVSGTVTLEDVSNPNHQAVTIVVRPQNALEHSHYVTLDASGHFTLEHVEKSQITLHIKGAKWLAKNVAINATNGDVTNVNASLLGGDANNSNLVDVNDLAVLIASFDAAPTDPNWNNGKADFDANNIVDVDDFALLIRNFDQNGDA